MQASGPAEASKAESQLTAALGGLRVVAEQYPQLRATENFQQLQAQLSETEDQIQITRRVYNDTVQTYNTLIQQFPASVLANQFNFEPRQFFDAPTESEATPEVSFSGDERPAAPAHSGSECRESSRLSPVQVRRCDDGCIPGRYLLPRRQGRHASHARSGNG